jgi:hypothetical protein
MQLSSAVLKLLAAVVDVLLFTKFPLVALVQAFESSPPVSAEPDNVRPLFTFCESDTLFPVEPGVVAVRFTLLLLAAAVTPVPET